MTQLTVLRFEASEQAMLDEIDRHLRALGWAVHVTVASLLRDWRELSATVDRYEHTIDDYTDDLTGRDAIEVALAKCSGAFRSKVKACVDQCDQQFLARTEDDTEELLGQFYRIDASFGWWWRRRPTGGPLADYLSDTARM